MFQSQYECDQNMQFATEQHLHHRTMFNSSNEEIDNQVSFQDILIKKIVEII